MTGDTQPPPPPPARARRVAEGLLPLYMSIRSKRPTGSGVRRRLFITFLFCALHGWMEIINLRDIYKHRKNKKVDQWNRGICRL